MFLSRLIKHAISSHSESQSQMDRDLHSQVEKVRRNTQINIRLTVDHVLELLQAEIFPNIIKY